jgi:hypothetical protein
MKVIFCDGMVELNDRGQRIKLGYLNLGAVPNYLSIILVMLIGCKHYIQNNAGGYRPKNANFKLLPLPTDSFFTENRVYFKENFIPERSVDKSPRFKYYRFFSSGHVICNISNNHKPNKADVDNLDAAFIGYYKLDSSNVTMELFNASQGGYYLRFYGSFVNNKLVLSHYAGRGSWLKEPIKPNEIYEEIEVDSLTSVPNW